MIGKGVHKEYRDKARKGGDILWHATVKGRKELAPGIRLHFSLKVFEDKKDMDMEEIKNKVKEFHIRTPDPSKLQFKTTVFHVKATDKDYYMLMISGVDKEYEKFYNSLKHCGTVYDNGFMPHITIDKDLYDQINKEGLKPEEVVFEDLTAEYGAGNTVCEFSEFEKSEHFVQLMKEAALFTELRDSAVVALPDSMFKNWLQDNHVSKMEIFAKHEDRVKFHFGTDAIAKYAVTHGIARAYEFLRKNKCS